MKIQVNRVNYDSWKRYERIKERNRRERALKFRMFWTEENVLSALVLTSLIGGVIIGLIATAGV